MEIKKEWQGIGTERENALYHALNKINVKYQYLGQGDFTSQHSKFSCVLYDNKNNDYNFIYQCNLNYTKPTDESILSCVISDAFCYRDCMVGDDDDNIQEFFNIFGYEKIKECLTAFKGCKKAYESIKKMLNDEEIEIIREYLEEIGEF